jgi:hypothetical protein
VATRAGLATQAEELHGWNQILTRGQEQARPGQRSSIPSAARRS